MAKSYSHSGFIYRTERMELELQRAVDAARQGRLVFVRSIGGEEIYQGQRGAKSGNEFQLKGVLPEHFEDGGWRQKLDKARGEAVWGVTPPRKTAPVKVKETGNEDLLGPVWGEDEEQRGEHDRETGKLVHVKTRNIQEGAERRDGETHFIGFTK